MAVYLTLRQSKGSELTWAELDGNFTSLSSAIDQISWIVVNSFELGATITVRNQALRYTATGELYRWDGALPKVVAPGSTPETSGGIGDGAWLLVNSSTSGGGGIIYSNILPTTLIPGVTYFDAEAMELVFSYQDTDSTQYLAFPLLAGSGSLNFVGGSGGGSTTVSNAGSITDGAALVQNLVGSNYPVRRIKAGVAGNVTITESGNSVIIETLTPVNDGAIGIGLINVKTATTMPFKRVQAGAGMSIVDNGTYLTFNATGGGTLGDTLTRLQGIDPPQNNNVPVFTAAGATQFLTTASTRAMMGLSTVANTFPLFTGTSTASLATLTPFMVTLLEKTGVPTALAHLKITTGSNANGGWLRIATGDTSGFQACWHAIVCTSAATVQGGGYVGANTSWTFPQVFNGLPSVSAMVQDGVQAWITNGSTGNSNTAASFRQQSFVNGPGDTAVSVMAIGFY